MTTQPFLVLEMQPSFEHFDLNLPSHTHLFAFSILKMAAKTADELSKLALNGTKDKATNPQINGTNGTNGNLSDRDSDDDKEDDAAAGNTVSGAAKKKKKRKPKKKKAGAKFQSDPPRVPVA